jgi:hypothetical protein
VRLRLAICYPLGTAWKPYFAVDGTQYRRRWCRLVNCPLNGGRQGPPCGKSHDILLCINKYIIRLGISHFAFKTEKGAQFTQTAMRQKHCGASPLQEQDMYIPGHKAVMLATSELMKVFVQVCPQHIWSRDVDLASLFAR